MTTSEFRHKSRSAPAATARSRILLALALVAAAVGVGCGSSSSGVGLGSTTNNSILKGQYAFSFSGVISLSSTSLSFVTAAGTFTADGNGNITTGQEDFSVAGSHSSTVTFSGTYAVGSDNRGNFLLKSVPGCATWQFTMANSGHGLMNCFGPTRDPVITASGAFDIQDPSAFSADKLTGGYVFSFAGLGVNGGDLVLAGDWQMSGAGGITGGEVDVNDTLTVTQDTALSGSYTVASSGRGTATLSFGGATYNYAFYVVNAGDMKFVETDSVPLASGEVRTQAAAPFNLASAGYVFIFAGADSLGLPIVAGGVMTSSGNGSLTAGVFDVNDDSFVLAGTPFTSTYTFNATGRGVASLGGFQFAFYPGQDGSLALIETDNRGVTGGTAKVQSGSSFSVSSISGNFAALLTGSFLNGTPTAAQEEDITGQLVADGAGNLSGTLDINNFGSLTQGLPLTASNYSMTSNGRGTATINTSTGNFNLQTYQVDSNTVFFLDLDTGRVMSGVMQK